MKEKRGIVLEGGTFRPIFSAGAMDALLDNGIRFPYVIGVSAGATNALSYVSGQKGRNLEVLLGLRRDKRYIGLRNFFREKCYFGLGFSFNVVPRELYPLDYNAIEQYEGEFKVGITDAVTGEADYRDGTKIEGMTELLEATCAIPLMFPTITIDGRAYYDGGVADPIPIRKAIADGSEKNLVILTREKGYVKELNSGVKIAARSIRKKYPKFAELLLRRHEEYNDTVRYVEELEREGKAVVLRPEYPLRSRERDLRQIKKNYEHGYDMMTSRLDEVKKLFI